MASKHPNVWQPDRLEATEDTPLLSQKDPQPTVWGKSVVYRALFAAFLISMTFGVTQVPLVYVFKLMTEQACDGRCSIREIEASTARSVALMGALTSVFGTVNLFITGWSIKKIGVKAALLFQVFFPAVRLTIQNIGVEIGSARGIWITQSSQITNILGGPAGYLLALNSFVTEVSHHEERTGALGRLQGAQFFGMAIGFWAGGIIGDKFGIIWPFRVTLGLFLLCCCYVFLFLPWVPHNKAEKASAKGIKGLFAPLRIYVPQKWVHPGGNVHREFGALLLGIGVYLGVLATGYIPVLLQMYSTDNFGFGTTENGNLIFIYSLLRGLFLMFAFPRIIDIGRAWLKRRDNKPSIVENGKPTENGAVPDLLPTEPQDMNIPESIDNEQEPIAPPERKDEKETFAFDLFYSKFSLILDGILTLGATFVTRGWQLYLVAAVLPFAAGTGAAAKGTILQMCLPSERTDALSAITLTENLARLSTTLIFGGIFAAFATIGKTYLVFTVNAGVALLGFVILLFSRFPPEGSKRFDDDRAHEASG